METVLLCDVGVDGAFSETSLREVPTYVNVTNPPGNTETQRFKRVFWPESRTRALDALRVSEHVTTSLRPRTPPRDAHSVTQAPENCSRSWSFPFERQNVKGPRGGRYLRAQLITVR